MREIARQVLEMREEGAKDGKERQPEHRKGQEMYGSGHRALTSLFSIADRRTAWSYSGEWLSNSYGLRPRTP